MFSPLFIVALFVLAGFFGVLVFFTVIILLWYILTWGIMALVVVWELGWVLPNVFISVIFVIKFGPFLTNI